ncbi:MAG: hypothetical protein OEQ39_04145 [Gammaproteobacteria bacterium]|nr:hypothetical protein [Gammaproteobacteria bacterium]MDH3466197.1 hypothetical protein [Gammaproteobacteria bacterium]
MITKARLDSLKTYCCDNTVLELVAEIERLDAALASLSDPDWWDGETINTAMDFAKKERAGE